jgi:exo-beta-1,3-glucanase (GH17 family)
MSYRNEKFLSLLGKNLDQLKENELQEASRSILDDGLHGICFSLYEDGQGPGNEIADEQIIRRLEILKPHTKWIRTFSSLDEHGRIAQFAKGLGFQTLVGAWLSGDTDKNDEEINGLIDLANAGFVDVAAVGNEVIYRKELEEAQLIDYINNVKQKIDVPVGYVDAYYEFRDRPNISDACDVILANCYPFWEGCSAEYALIYMKDMYQEATKAAKGKKVIITETGWPSEGSSLGGANPSYSNYLKYFINSQLWSKDENVEMFYFSSFDESWKVDAEGDVGAFWGLWDKLEKLKF